MPELTWLATILNQALLMPNDCQVIPIESHSLKGGCHFHVWKVSLAYDKANDDLPKSIIFKSLEWNKTFLEKIHLFLKNFLRLDDREIMYLNSYKVEIIFYQVYSKYIQGLKVPKIYYINANPFQNIFQLVMEDISHCENGQKAGFSWDESIMCLRNLAIFHTTNWNEPLLKNRESIWNTGGYWTGCKREANKREIRQAWDSFRRNFPQEIEIPASASDLGSILQSRLDDITCAFTNLDRHTLVHGDYKITNIFIDKNPTEKSVYAIDWQWFGIGNVAIDVAYFIITSIEESIIENSLELVQIYHQVLTDHGISYSWEQFWEAYKICWIDFCIYTVTAKWSNMHATDVETYQKEGKDGLHLRSYAHMERLVIQTEEFLMHP